MFCFCFFFQSNFNLNIEKYLNDQTQSCSDRRNVHSRELWNIKNPSKRQWQIIWQQPEAAWLVIYSFCNTSFFRRLHWLLSSCNSSVKRYHFIPPTPRWEEANYWRTCWKTWTSTPPSLLKWPGSASLRSVSCPDTKAGHGLTWWYSAINVWCFVLWCHQVCVKSGTSRLCPGCCSSLSSPCWRSRWKARSSPNLPCMTKTVIRTCCIHQVTWTERSWKPFVKHSKSYKLWNLQKKKKVLIRLQPLLQFLSLMLCTWKSSEDLDWFFPPFFFLAESDFPVGIRIYLETYSVWKNIVSTADM